MSSHSTYGNNVKLLVCIQLEYNASMCYSWANSLWIIRKVSPNTAGLFFFFPHVLHRGAGVHARPSVSAADVNAWGDAALTHAAPEGWMSRRLSQRLELCVSPCAKLHIKNAPFKRKRKKKNRGTLSFLWAKTTFLSKMWLIWIVLPTRRRPIKKNETPLKMC